MTVQIEVEGGELTDPVGGIDVPVVASETGATAFENPEYDFELRNTTLSADGSPRTVRGVGTRTDADRLSLPLSAFMGQDGHGRGGFYDLDHSRCR